MLSISQGNLTPVFNGSTTTYTDVVSNGVTSLTVTPVAGGPEDTVTVNGQAVAGAGVSAPIGLAVGDNTVSIVVTVRYGRAVTYVVTVNRASAGGAGGRVNTPPATPQPVSSTTGSATVDPAAGGTVSLGTAVVLSIPSGALQGSDPVDVAVRQVTAPPAVDGGFTLLGSTYDFSVGGGRRPTPVDLVPVKNITAWTVRQGGRTLFS